MPNWCNNTLRISGDKEVISRIKDWYEEYQSNRTDVGLFGTFYPLPEELENTQSPSREPNKALIEKYGVDNWYDWKVQNWGTKWDTGEVCLVGETGNEISLSFDTAWSPPIQFYEKLSEDYPKLHIRASYYEPGMDYCGTFDSSGGQCEDYCISGIITECLDKYKVYSESFGFASREEFIEELNCIYGDLSLSQDFDFDLIFDDYYFEERLEDAEFCKEYKIKKESQ